MLEVRRRPQTRADRPGAAGRAAWQVIAQADLAALQRSADSAWSTSVVISRADLANAEAVIRGLRELELKDSEILTVTRAVRRRRAPRHTRFGRWPRA